MSTPDATAGTAARCPTCGARLLASVGGLCAACLMRLAAPDSEPVQEAEPDTGPAALEEWLRIKGQRIGNCELLDEIARGGMGIVYRARQLTAGRVVAVKVLLPHLKQMPGMLERFRNEAQAVAQLDHPGILPIYEVGEHDGLPFFSMKFADGGGLDRHVSALQGDWTRIATVMAKVAHAVEHAHQRGILHRDLKPANILFDGRGDPMVADFGLVKFRASDHGLTLPAAALGSPNYMAPEQISAQFGDIGPTCDVYSLGAVLYELLTGRPPILGKGALDTMRLVPTQPAVSGIRTRPDLPADLDAIAMKCLAKQPADRYASADDLARDLERWLAGDTVSARAALRVRDLRRWGLVALGLLLTAGIAAGAWRGLQAFVDRGRLAPVATTQAVLHSIGVMAFRNLSGSRDDDYLSWTVTDDLLHELRQIRSLNVVPFRVEMDSSRGFRPAELASRLGVDMVLDGDYRRSGSERLAVRARLWDAKTGRALWQYSFAAPLGDAREIRAQIATALVTRLQIEIGADLLAQFGRDSVTASPEAYTSYLRARYLVRWRRHETLVEAARLLRKAIELDPQFARAYSALAYTYILWVGDAPPEGFELDLAVTFARRALEIDPQLAEPHAVLADYHSNKGQPIDAELDFRRAVELDPRDPATLHLYAVHLYSVGRLREARDVERRSVALDNTSPQPMMWLAMLTTTIGDPEEARRLWAQTDELGAARPICAAISRLSIGEKEPLAEWYRTSYAEAKVPESMRGMQPLLAGVVDSAHREAARQYLQGHEGQIEPAFLITHYALLDAPDDAFRVAANFELVDDEYYHYQLCNIWSPRTASMRRDPRFGALMQRWGFMDYWQRFGPPDACSLADGRLSCR